MNDRLTRKKHSRRIAKLALQKGIIDQELYDQLHMLEEGYIEQKRHKKRWSRYYSELYYWTCDYFGECDEHSIIEHVKEILFWSLNDFDNNGDIIKPIKFNYTASTKKVIEALKVYTHREFNYDS